MANGALTSVGSRRTKQVRKTHTCFPLRAATRTVKPSASALVMSFAAKASSLDDQHDASRDNLAGEQRRVGDVRHDLRAKAR